MIRSVLVALLLCVAGPARGAGGMTGTAESLPRTVQGSAGGAMSGAGYKLNAAVGEAAASVVSAAPVSLDAGFMPLAAQPGTITSIVAVTKTTGTIELSWTAPGLDGFVGTVGSGFYRIDYSSEPGHVFAPTTYRLELATAAVPGERHSYTLTGLETNTTYYARVYLSDTRKMVAETSDQSDESTLANAPAPAFSGVFATSVTIAWTLPAGGAAGYRIDATTTNFGQLFPGGVVTSSLTPNGLAVTLTIVGLAAETTYYFKLGSLNWQSDFNFDTVLATCTLPGGVPPISDFAASGDALARTISLTWTNPDYPNAEGVTILVSTNPITQSLANGTTYQLGALLADFSQVKSTAMATSYLETGLALDTTHYFALYSRGASNTFSVAVSTQIVLDIPPMAPAGLAASVDQAGSSIALTWSTVSSNIDGSAFRFSSAWELQRYDIQRATGIVRATWVTIASVTANATGYLAAIPDPNNVYYYRVVARDGYQGSWTDRSMAVDTLGNLYAVGADQVSRLRLPPSLAGVVAPTSGHGGPLLLRATDRPQDLGGRIVRSVAMEALVAPAGRAVSLGLPQSEVDVVLRYETVGGQVVPSSAGQPLAGLSNTISAADAPTRLSMYVGGEFGDARKVFGRVDPAAQTVAVQTALLGNYQIRSLLRDADFTFDPSGVSNRALTPNNDGLNDTVVFVFDNPKDSSFSGRIYDMQGALVAEMQPGPVARASLLWDGKSGGAVVPRGVYVYRIQAEGRSYTGTLVVIR